MKTHSYQSRLSAAQSSHVKKKGSAAFKQCLVYSYFSVYLTRNTTPVAKDEGVHRQSARLCWLQSHRNIGLSDCRKESGENSTAAAVAVRAAVA